MRFYFDAQKALKKTITAVFQQPAKRTEVDVMTRKSYAETITALSDESTNRLLHHVNREFPSKERVDSGSNFDDRVRDCVLKYALNPDSCRDENRYLDSIGYGCERKPQMLVDALETFAGYHQNSSLWNQNVREAIKYVEKMTSPRNPLKIREANSPELLSDALSKKDASAGFDWIISGKKHKGDYIDEATELFEDSLTFAMKNGTFGMPIITYHRLQVSGAYDDKGNRTPDKVKKKERLVNAVSMRVIQHELSTSRAVQSHMGRCNFYAGGKTPTELHQLINSERMKHKYWFSLDYSKYDQTIPGWLIRVAFDIIWSWFSRDRGTQAYKPVWDIIVSDFINKAFVGPKGQLVYASDGVPSGSMFTQIIDTIVNLVMVHSYVNAFNRRNGMRVRVKCIICGDDNLIFSNYKFDLADMLGYINRMFGIVGHPEKCDFGECRSDDPIFLSRTWRTRGVWRNPKELFAKMIYPERFRNYAANPQLNPELIVYSYILAYPLGMRELIDVDKFMDDNKCNISDFSDSVLDHVGGFLAYMQQYG